jgi:L-cysteine:1D-myo-inositol 2-amino-2-deoxy-alpha-D-glucopyranoside ligase
MHLFDTRVGSVLPLDAGPLVTMYTCGITPYDAAHLGHAAVYVTYDVLQRRLRDQGHEVRCVRNVTDVDDDILRKARELGVHYLDLAAQELARFDRDMAALGVLPVYAAPRATSAIPDILKLIGATLDAGAAYESGGAIYFRVAAAPDFGSLSHLGRDEMLVLAKENGGRPEDPAKHDPLDFVLWQPSLPDEPSWDSRFGPGRPGWHIECSALALRELGETIDVHGGGRDLVFPHHECEAVQSHAVTRRPLARRWVHCGLVGLDGTKMSKSLGNLVFVSDLLERAPAGAARLALLGHHYRGDWEWTDADLPAGIARREAYLARTGGHDGTALLDDVRAALDDDLDAPGALDALDAAPDGTDLSPSLALLGVTL